MNSDMPLIIYFILLITGLVATRFSQPLQASDKWIQRLLLLTLLSEIFAEFCTRTFHANLFVYHFFNPLQLLLIAMYFNESMPALKKSHAGQWIGMGGIGFALTNTLFFQPLSTLNTNFLLFEAFVIIALCIHSFASMFKTEAEVAYLPHFWICSLLIFYWAFTFFYWGVYTFLTAELQPIAHLLWYSLYAVNIITYAGFTVIFLRYRKLITYRE